ncbi:MAG: sulfatase-like hydrolase/transferase, partial [Myxococcota bacterium]
MIGAWLACAPPRPPDLVLVTLDTTRADRIGAYGWAEPTPAIDALAARGRRYAEVYSPIPLTVGAHASLFTGQLPARTQVRSNFDRLPPAATTLAEQLRGAGYTTAGFVGAVVTSRAFGFDQGFDAFDDSFPGEERPADEVVDAALRWWSSRDPRRPAFLWVHLYDPHLPNRPGPGRPDPYDAAIGACDDGIGRLVAALDPHTTVVAVVGDHGESRGDHGEVAHGLYVYPATQRVPWVVAGPGIAASVEAAPVSLVDVAPTLLAAVGAPALPDPDGRATPAPARPIALESYQLQQRFGLAPHLGWIDDGYLVLALPRPELYDLRVDPGATSDRSAAEPERVASMLRRRPSAPPPPRRQNELDPQLVQALATLGYTDGAEEPAGPLPDPKDHTGLLRRVEQAELVGFEGRFAEADAMLQRLVAEYPGIAELRGRRAWLLLGAGRAAEAQVELRAALALDPGDPSLQVGYASALAGAGRYAEAAELFQAAADGLPDGSNARAMAVRAWTDAGELDRALALAAGWREQHPEELALAGVTGLALVRAGRFADALPLLQRAAEAPTPEAGVLVTLAGAAAGRG